MPTLYVFKEGSYLRKEGERLKVTFEKRVIADVPLLNVTQVALFGPIQISTQALAALLQRNIDVVFLTKAGRFKGRVEGVLSKNSILRKAQLRASENEEKCVEIAKKLVFGKLCNMKTLLLRHCRQGVEEPMNKSIEQINESLKKLEKAKSLEEVRGSEGTGSSFYFYAFKYFLKKDNFSFQGRLRRPPRDPVNALLSFGYTLLFKDMVSICELVGLDPYVGFLHSIKYGKASLALDLMEEWRPVIVDTLVLSLINKGKIKADDFEESSVLGVKIKEQAKKSFVEAYEAKKLSTIKHSVLKQNLSYWRAMELQARILAKVVSGQIGFYKPFLIR